MKDELARLTEMLIEERLSSEEMVRLKKIIAADPQALEEHVDTLFNHAVISYEASGRQTEDFDTSFPTQLEVLAEHSLGESPFAEHSKKRSVSNKRKSPSFSNGKAGGFRSVITKTALGLLAFCCLVAIAVTWFSKGTDEFATIVKTTNCLWNDSVIKTAPPTRIGPCVLRLEQGIALIRFDSGVLISLEGPCSFEVKEKMLAVLHFGSLVATIETPEGNGFVVDTPHASIKDLGTSFGLQTSGSGKTSVYVIDGKVEVVSKIDHESVSRLKKGESMMLGSQGKREAGLPPPVPATLQTLQFNSTLGRGREVWVVNQPQTLLTSQEKFPTGIFEAYMLVKLSVDSDSKSDKKAVFRIDLGDFARKKDILAAVLHLAYGPTGIGYASHVPDATFTVYGLTDESGDAWKETDIDWQRLPGNGDRNGMLPSHWRPLGTFNIKQGCPTGTVQIDSSALCRFVREDSNNLLTFAIVCDTVASDMYGLVFGFANRNHPTLSPPRLNLIVTPNETTAPSGKEVTPVSRP